MLYFHSSQRTWRYSVDPEIRMLSGCCFCQQVDSSLAGTVGSQPGHSQVAGNAAGTDLMIRDKLNSSLPARRPTHDTPTVLHHIQLSTKTIKDSVSIDMHGFCPCFICFILEPPLHTNHTGQIDRAVELAVV